MYFQNGDTMVHPKLKNQLGKDLTVLSSSTSHLVPTSTLGQARLVNSLCSGFPSIYLASAPWLLRDPLPRIPLPVLSA